MDVHCPYDFEQAEKMASKLSREFKKQPMSGKEHSQSFKMYCYNAYLSRVFYILYQETTGRNV